MNTDMYNNNSLWWIECDWMRFKVPVSLGEPSIPHDILNHGFEIGPTRERYEFQKNLSDRRLIADFSFFPCSFFVNERTYKNFGEFFCSCGRIYRVSCDSLPYYIVLVDTKHDAVDLDKSVFKKITEDDRPVERNISQILKIFIRKEFHTEDDIFRIDKGFALSQEIIVSSEFKKRYEEIGCSGLIFNATCD